MVVSYTVHLTKDQVSVMIISHIIPHVFQLTHYLFQQSEEQKRILILNITYKQAKHCHMDIIML
jgi:hypothetical protein